MILVDTNEATNKHSSEIVSLLRRLGLEVESTPLPYGDICMEGNGPEGATILIGIERKKLGDMLNCIESARYNEQRIGMKNMYQQSILLLEGVWSVGGPPFQQGALIDCSPSGAWKPYLHAGRRVMYSKLYRYLLSVALSGVTVTYSRDIVHTAFNVAEIFHYFQKKWEAHTSLLEIHKVVLPDMNGKASLTRRWASDIKGVGVKGSERAERVFKTPLALAQADESDWMEVEGIGGKVARDIVKQIRGGK